MKQQNESVEKLEVGKDYVNVHDSNLIVIDRIGIFDNKGFYEDIYRKDIPCINYVNWREATEEEVIEAFKRHLVHRYGEDWKAMKIKEMLPESLAEINDGSWEVEISKYRNGWCVWNKNGVLYSNGIWVERLEDVEAMNKKEKEKLPIDKVTTRNLDIALRMVGIQLDISIIDKVIDLVELIENKGDDVTIKDVVSLQQTWSRHS